MMEEVKIKFLFIRFSSIGDIVLTTPVVRCLRQQVEGAEIHFLTKSNYAFLLKNNPYIDKIHVLKKFGTTINELRDEGFDYVIDLHHNLRSLRVKHRLKVIDFSFPKLNKEKFLLTNFKIDRLPDIHIVDRYFETVQLFDVENDMKGLDYFPDKYNPEEIHQIIGNNADKYMVVAIGGQHFTKKMPSAKIVELCRMLKCRIVLIGGNEDLDVATYIVKEADNDNLINACGILTVDQSAILIANAALIITHDTGMMHIAAAYHKIIFSVWGNTTPRFGMSPYLPDSRSMVFEVNDIKCRPCSKLGFKKCPRKHFDCMMKQNIALIAAEVNKIANQ